MHRRIAIAGESECGKSTLAKSLSRELWKRFQIRSLVYDPWRDVWGGHAWVTKNFETFNEAVNKANHCLVIIEDASMTIQRDKSFAPFFTCIRHRNHDLMVLCHDATDLLPSMRRNINEIFLFNQTEDSVEQWKSSQPSMRGLEVSVGLPQYCFVHSKKFGTVEPRPQRLKL
jgi:hypothetical protein